jgi:hypothetical protein
MANSAERFPLRQPGQYEQETRPHPHGIRTARCWCPRFASCCWMLTWVHRNPTYPRLSRVVFISHGVPVKAIRQPGALRSIRRIALRRSPVSFEHCDATGSWTTSDNLRDGFPTICKRSYPGTGEVSLAFQRASKRVQQGAPEIPLLPLTAGTTAMYTATGAAPQYILHADWLGSSRLGYNSSNSGSGKLDGDQAYGPFGESYNVSGNSLNVFTGQTADMGIVAGSSPIYDFCCDNTVRRRDAGWYPIPRARVLWMSPTHRPGIDMPM